MHHSGLALSLTLLLLTQSGTAVPASGSCNVSTVTNSIFKQDLGYNVDSIALLANAQIATSFALVYGVAFQAFATFVLPPLTIVGSNAVYSEKQLSSASGAAVIRPNVDTLYSRIAVDLSQYDVEITVPPIEDGRFWIFPFYDIYGDNIANLGSVNKSSCGTYLMRLVNDEARTPGLQLGDFNGKYKGIINFPTTYGFLLIRILVRSNTTADIDKVHCYQNGIFTKLVNKTSPPSQTPIAPPLTPSLLQTDNTTSAEMQLLTLTARLLPYSPPELRSTLPNITYNLALAGLSSGVYWPPPNVNLTTAAFFGAISVLTDLTSPSKRVDFGNNWTTFSYSISGNFGSEIAARAYIDANALGQLDPYEAIYPEYIGENFDASFNFTKGQAITFAFSGKPPVNGFWSLTAYNSANYLIPNPLNRYALGDRSNLTYPNGQLVYGFEGAASAGDGPFEILVQAADVPPPANWTSNWLPGPAGGGVFAVNLRLYAPTEAATNGSYLYPVVTKHAAIT